MKWILLVLFLVLLVPPAYAAFPAPASVNNTTEKKSLAFREIKSLLQQAPRPAEEATVEQNIPGLLSFIFSLAAIPILFAGPLAVLSPLLLIAAIVLGAIGLRKKPRGLALAGLIISIVELSLGLLILLLVLALDGLSLSFN